MKKFLIAFLISLCIKVYMCTHICSVLTEVIAKLLPSILLICLYIPMVSSSLPVWTLFRPALDCAWAEWGEGLEREGRTQQAVFEISASGGTNWGNRGKKMQSRKAECYMFEALQLGTLSLECWCCSLRWQYWSEVGMLWCLCMCPVFI